ncbi:uncharacterized protein CIMG_12566 [Coccidioides immitis RS]|uniref:Uncharacterized protein n=1 Tax=Coccidioides immitis (strain RS) TaxID=246410 RepID=J3K092_COCIM|nr:uncharacterized protein CIMG_12566 [Coccidioides immitis RS]EAS27242.3 hypothetical protein CIMG_12566 [Coccidioides immitis RS]
MSFAVISNLLLFLLLSLFLIPNERELASIISQVLKGLSGLAAAGLELESLTCSNVLIGLDRVVKIGTRNIPGTGLESCMELTRGQPQSRSIRALANIMMELMQKYDKDGGLVGVDDLERWPLNSDAVEFLVAVRASSRCRKKRSRLPTSPKPYIVSGQSLTVASSSAGSIKSLEQHPLIMKQRQSPGELVGLARLALISTRTFYSYKEQC